MMSFTEFCCRSGGSNLNAGTRTGNSTEPGTSADLTYASGSWVSATGVFTVASGDPTADGVVVGDFASVYADGASVTTLVGRVTARTSTTITVSTTAKSGTTTDGTSNRTLKIGGAWQGPNGSSGFPMNFVTNALTNSGGDLSRINYKNAATYNITANISTVNADTRHQGYTSSYGDFGRAVLDGGTSGASYNLIGTTVGSNAVLADFECCNNGATGTSGGVFWNSTGMVLRCVFHNFRGNGLQSNNGTRVIECEAYSCNASNSSNVGGFSFAGAGTTVERCFSHDNSTSNAIGFTNTGGQCDFVKCIADTNGSHGFLQVSASQCAIEECDAYNNAGSGIFINAGLNLNTHIENCNLTKNGAWGILISGAGKVSGSIYNCGFGSGTEANASGQISGNSYMETAGNVTYPSNSSPHNAPTTGDFTIVLAEAKGAGRGSFLQTASGYTGTTGHQGIGAAQHADSGGGGTVIVIED